MSPGWHNIIRKSRWVAGVAAFALFCGMSLAMVIWIRDKPDQPAKNWMPKHALARLKHPHRVSHVAFSPDSRTLITGTYDARNAPDPLGVMQPTLWGWDWQLKEPMFALPCHDGRLLSLTIAPDGKTAATAGEGGFIRFWDLARKQETNPMGPALPGQSCVTYSANAKYLAAVASNTVRMWEVASGELIHEWAWPSACTIAFSPDDRILACVGGGNVKIVFWDTITGKELSQANLTGGNGISLVFSPDGQTVATGGNGIVQFLHVPSGTEKSKIDHRIPRLAYSPNGRMLATSGIRDGKRDRAVLLWETTTGKERRRFDGHDDYVLYIAFSPDGRAVASASEDTVLLWDLTDRDKGVVLLTDDECRTLWTNLASADATLAYEAIRAFTSAGPTSVPFLKDQMRKALTGIRPVTPREVALWFGSLSNADPLVRKKILADLEFQGESVLPLLHQTLKQKPPREISDQLEILLELLPKVNSFLNSKPISSENLRLWRALEVLENIGNAESREAAEWLGQHAPELRLAQEAHFASQRMTAALKH